jgi:uroporphyrin-III C-methyltransferase/precorrin-2 dehydrogenase/sirohydrochlorin ferrochelatase
MRHFPIFLDTTNRNIIVSGAGECAVAKLRLLLKTQAKIFVFGHDPEDIILEWAKKGLLIFTERSLKKNDIKNIILIYGANENSIEDARIKAISNSMGVLINIVDNLNDSEFITPAIVDRDPLTIAIGTEGTAPVLARNIKKQLEEILPTSLGILARIGQSFRNHVEILPMGQKRRNFWTKFYFHDGPQALQNGGENEARNSLNSLLKNTLETKTDIGRVHLIGAGPGDPDLLTLKARKLLHEADVVIHDQLVSEPILELARREAIIVETGKKGFGKSWYQDDINALMIKHAGQGKHVVRLKSGDPTMFGRLDEEMSSLDQAGILYDITPGITAASAAVATINQSLTKRGRNSSVLHLTGHDINGFADQDWRILSIPGTVAAIYMGKRAAQFLQGRLLMYGTAPNTPITIVANASRPNQKILDSQVGSFSEKLTNSHIDGPIIFLLGLAPRDVFSQLQKSSNQIEMVIS